MTARCVRAIKRFRVRQRSIVERFDEFEKSSIGRLAIKIVGLVANGITHSAFHAVIVVVEHFLERATINDGLIALEARPLFALESLYRDGTKFNPFDRLPRRSSRLRIWMP